MDAIVERSGACVQRACKPGRERVRLATGDDQRALRPLHWQRQGTGRFES